MTGNNSINNTIPDNDFSVSRDTAGTSVVNSANHTDNASTSSHANFLAETGGASGGDPFIRLNIPSGQDYSFGIDNSATDILKLTDDANPSTGTLLWSMTPAGEKSCPLQPAFEAYQSDTDNNVTGDSTTYTLGGTAMTEDFDQNADFDGSIFTAPSTGVYYLGTNVGSTPHPNSSNEFIQIATSNNTYRPENCNPSVNRNDSSDSYMSSLSCVADMDAADTATFQFNVTNSSGKIIDVQKGAGHRCFVDGYLVG